MQITDGLYYCRSKSNVSMITIAELKDNIWISEAKYVDFLLEFDIERKLNVQEHYGHSKNLTELERDES